MKRSILGLFLIVSGFLPGFSGASNPAVLQKSLKMLADDTWRIRHEGTATLRKALEADRSVATALVTHYRENDDPEVRHRILELIRPVMSPDVLHPNRGRLGIRFAQKATVRLGDVPVSGFVVASVEFGLPAQLAGVKTGDLIVQLGDWNVSSESAMKEAEAVDDRTRPGEPLKIGLIRNGRKMSIQVTPAAREGYKPLTKGEYHRKFYEWLHSEPSL